MFVMFVPAVGPRMIELHLSSFAYIQAVDLDNPSKACFEAVYAVPHAAPLIEAVEQKFTILPLFSCLRK